MLHIRTANFDEIVVELRAALLGRERRVGLLDPFHFSKIRETTAAAPGVNSYLRLDQDASARQCSQLGDLQCVLASRS